MSIHLVGGGWTPDVRPAVYGPFVDEARRLRRNPRVGVIQLYDPTIENGAAKFEQFADILHALGVGDVTPLLVAAGDVLAPGLLADLDGLLVAGGPTPQYLTAVTPIAEEIRTLVSRGVPYLGFSAGAGVAATRALIGGWKHDDLVIAREDSADGIDQLTVAPGLGLVAFAVDAHAAQWGTLTRVVAAVIRGDVDSGVAIDEDTVCIVDADSTRTAGAGQVWWAARVGDTVAIRTTRGDSHH